MKRSYFGLIAIIVAIVSFAFTEVKKAPLPTCSAPKKWFEYRGPQFPGTATQADLLNPANYVEVATPTAEANCTDIDFLCAICAAENGTTNRPVIDATLQGQLTTYFQSSGTTVASSIVEKP